MEFGTTQFWVALAQIIGVNIVLSGDNAVVIALAARSLPPRQQKQAVMIGSVAAIVLRILLTIVAVELLRLPYLKIVGAVLLLWIGIQLLLPEKQKSGTAGSERTSMAAAVRTILLADLVMSVDNVIAVAAAAKDNLTLLVLGLLVSIPLVIFGSTLLMKYMERWPIIVVIGAGLLGWVAGEMGVSDPLVKDWVAQNARWLSYVLPAAGALVVIATGMLLAKRAETRMDSRPVIDLATATDQSEAAQPVEAASERMPVLVAVEESESSHRALKRLHQQLTWYRPSVDIHLLNVQHPANGDVSAFIHANQIKNYHHDRGAKALVATREILDRAGVPYTAHIGVGDAPHVILKYAHALQCRQIFLVGDDSETSSPILDSAGVLVRETDLPVTLV